MGRRKQKREQKKRIFYIVKNIILSEETIIHDKYRKSHGKIVLEYKEHCIKIIEVDHEYEERVILFNKSKALLTKKEYKKLINILDKEILKRQGVIKDFTYLVDKFFDKFTNKSKKKTNKIIKHKMKI